MDQVQAASQRLADGLANDVAAAWDSFESGGLSRREFEAVVVVLVARANQVGVQLADIGVTTEMIRQIRQPARPLGLAPTPVQVDTARIAADVDRILDATPITVSPEDLSSSRRVRLADWSRTEPLLTVASTVQVAMAERGANGWVRQTDSDPCPLCVAWADGVVRSPSTRMKRHNGCACIQRPVFGSEVSVDRESVARLFDDDLADASAAQNPGQMVQDLITGIQADIADPTRPRRQYDTAGGFTFI